MSSKTDKDIKKIYKKLCSGGAMTLETFAAILEGSGLKPSDVFAVKVLSETKVRIITVDGQKRDCEKIEVPPAEPKPKKDNKKAE